MAIGKSRERHDLRLRSKSERCSLRLRPYHGMTTNCLDRERLRSEVFPKDLVSNLQSAAVSVGCFYIIIPEQDIRCDNDLAI